MDVSGPESRARAVRGGLGAAAVLLGAGLVAVASSGGVAEGGVRRPGDRVLDLVFSFGAVAFGAALLAGALLFAVGWHLSIRAGRRPSRSRWLASFGFFLAGLAVLTVFLYVRRRVAQPTVPDGAGPAGPTGGSAAGRGGGGYEPEFATGPVLVFLAALAAALVALWLWRRSRREPAAHEPDEPLPTLTELLADTLDDLRHETDPRRAVIAAYARLEQALAGAGHPRRRSDAPGEYLARVLREADVSPTAVSRLTGLFAQAKFSQHAVGEARRNEAIEALDEVRRDLRAAEEAGAARVPA